MTYNLSTTANRTILSAVAALTLAAALPATSFAAPAEAVQVWSINSAKSKFGPKANTIVLERKRANAASQAPASNGDGSFMVISNGFVYLAKDENAANADGIAKVNYAGWRNMKLTLVGEKVRSEARYSFRSQMGLPDNRPVTLIFTPKGNVAPQQFASAMVIDPR